jgi:hypothetical protein
MPERQPPIDILASSFDDIAAALASRDRPPVESWDPPHCGHSGMRIDRAGRWWHEGRRIEREALVRLFASVLRREPDGRHLLITPVEKLDIDVELAALRATAMKREGDGQDQQLVFQLNDGRAVFLGAANPLSLHEGLPLISLDRGLQASLERPVYFELAELALLNDPLGVWSAGHFYAMDGG